MSYFKKMFIAGILISMFIIAGCTPPEQQSGNTIAIENKVRVVTTKQLKKISQKMTYNEVLVILGNSIDVGSGRHIKKYEHSDGREFTLNFGHDNEVISESDFSSIQNIIKHN